MCGVSKDGEQSIRGDIESNLLELGTLLNLVEKKHCSIVYRQPRLYDVYSHDPITTPKSIRSNFNSDHVISRLEEYLPLG